MLAGKNNFLSGHRIRHAVAKAARPGGPLHGLLDVYGTIDGGNHVPTEIAYDEYFFNLAVCNSQYNFWATEKVFNPMAAKTVPIYWGSPSLEPLRPYGFTDLGLIRWDGSVESLEKILRELQNDPEKVYTEKYEAIQQNYEATHRWWCHELTLESVLRDFFGFPVNEDLPKMLT